MFQTKVTEMLGIEYPIVGGTMMRIATPEFTSAVSNAGGLGILASAMYQSREEFADAVGRYLPWVKTPDDVIALVDTYLVQHHANDIMHYRFYADHKVVMFMMETVLLQDYGAYGL